MGSQKLVASGCRAMAAYCTYQSIISLLQCFALASVLMTNGYPKITAIAQSASSFLGFWIGAGLLMCLAEPLGRFAGRGHAAEEPPNSGVVDTASAAVPIFGLLLIAVALPSLVLTLVETYFGVQASGQTLGEYLAMRVSHDALRVIIYDVSCIVLGLAAIWFRPSVVGLIFGPRDAGASPAQPAD